MKVSVIIPVYNVENYLKKCVESVIGQSFSNIEIILVDDGSKDNSGLICDEFERQDDRVKVVHKENGGLSSARNAGLDLMTGDCAVFLDSDDYLSENYLQILVDDMQKENADMSVCCLVYVDENQNVIRDFSLGNQREIFDNKSAIIEMLNQNKFSHGAVCKLIKKELIGDIRFPVGRLFEDVATTYKIMLNAKKIVFNPNAHYFYLMRSNSIVHKDFNEKNFDLLEFTDKMVDDIGQIYPDLEYLCNRTKFWQRIMLYKKGVKKMDKQKEKELFCEIKDLRKKLDKKDIKNSKSKRLKMYYLFSFSKLIFDLALRFEVKRIKE